MAAEGITGFVIAYALVLVIAGIVAGITLGAASMGVSGQEKAGRKRMLKAAAVGTSVTLVFVGSVGLVLGAQNPEVPPNPCQPGYILVNGSCTPVTGITWTHQVAGTENHAQHDTAAEAPDAPLVPMDGGTPDLNLVMCVWETDAFYDQANSIWRWEIDVDDDAAPTAAGYQATDGCFMDVMLQPGFVDMNGDGDMDQIPYYARLRSITPGTTMQFSANNATQRDEQIAYWQSTVGWYFPVYGLEVDAPGWAHENADHGYTTACRPGSPGYSTSVLTQECYSQWIQLGVYDDGDPDAILIGEVANNNGLFGFNAQDNVGAFILAWDIGVPQSYFTIMQYIEMDSID